MKFQAIVTSLSLLSAVLASTSTPQPNQHDRPSTRDPPAPSRRPDEPSTVTEPSSTSTARRSEKSRRKHHHHHEHSSIEVIENSSSSSSSSTTSSSSSSSSRSSSSSIRDESGARSRRSSRARRGDPNNSLRVFKSVNSPLVLVERRVSWRRYPELCRSVGLYPAVINRCNFWSAVRLLRAARIRRAWARWDVRSFQRGILAPRNRRCRNARSDPRPEIFRQPTSIAVSRIGERMERWAESQLRLRAVGLCSKRAPSRGERQNAASDPRNRDETMSSGEEDPRGGATTSFEEELIIDEEGDPSTRTQRRRCKRRKCDRKGKCRTVKVECRRKKRSHKKPSYTN